MLAVLMFAGEAEQSPTYFPTIAMTSGQNYLWVPSTNGNSDRSHVRWATSRRSVGLYALWRILDRAVAINRLRTLRSDDIYNHNDNKYQYSEPPHGRVWFGAGGGVMPAPQPRALPPPVEAYPHLQA